MLSFVSLFLSCPGRPLGQPRVGSDWVGERDTKHAVACFSFHYDVQAAHWVNLGLAPTGSVSEIIKCRHLPFLLLSCPGRPLGQARVGFDWVSQ